LEDFQDLDYSTVLKKILIKEVKVTCNSLFIYFEKDYNFANLIYKLSIGVGMILDGEEQFTHLYSGNKHHLVIEDLTPKMNISLRVTPYLLLDDVEYQGESSDTRVITIGDPNSFDEAALSPIALLKCVNNDLMDIQFEKTGYIVSRHPIQ